MNDPNSGDLAKRVSELEAKVDLLIENLRANNRDFHALVVDLLQYTNAPEEQRKQFTSLLRDEICPRVPPGC